MMKKKKICICLSFCIMTLLLSACSFTEGFKEGFNDAMEGKEAFEKGEEATIDESN